MDKFSFRREEVKRKLKDNFFDHYCYIAFAVFGLYASVMIYYLISGFIYFTTPL